MAMHSIPSFFTGDVLDFGKEYLSQQGFGSFGIPLAIIIKGIHLLSIPLLLINRNLKFISILNIIIFIAGIIMIHAKNGWYVVGGGSNGVEYNFLLIFCFMSFIFPYQKIFSFVDSKK